MYLSQAQKMELLAEFLQVAFKEDKCSCRIIVDNPVMYSALMLYFHATF